MKRRMWTLVLCSCFASLGWAQTVTGSGTTNTIPQFTGSTTIGNSPIVQFNGNIGIGTATARYPLDIFGGTGTPANLFPQPILVISEFNSSADNAVALEGLASAGTGRVFGVAGTTFSDEGIGVIGNRANSVASGFGGGGVRGQTSAANVAFTYGTAGVATAPTGSSVGILGQTFSPNGTAGFFANAAGGNIIIGGVGQPAVAVFRVDGHGTIFADGGFRPFGADFAESLAVKGNRAHYSPGDLHPFSAKNFAPGCSIPLFMPLLLVHRARKETATARTPVADDNLTPNASVSGCRPSPKTLSSTPWLPPDHGIPCGRLLRI